MWRKRFSSDPLLGRSAGRPWRGSHINVNRRIDSAVPSYEGFRKMVYRTPSEWMLGRLRALTRRGFDFLDLVDAMEFRDFMLGASPKGASCEYFGLGSETRAIEFLNRLSAGEGAGAPLGDKFALAIRLTKVMRDNGASQALVEAMRAWLGILGDELSEFSSLRSVISMLQNEIWIRPST